MTIAGFDQFEFSAAGATKTVYYKGAGPGVVLLHEISGMIPECIALAERIAAEGYTVFMPLLFGRPNASLVEIPVYAIQLCVSREFYLFAKGRSSPVTVWLRALCREVQARTDGVGVGVIGMCLTGGFALTLMADDSVLAPVLSQPALPMGFSESFGRDLGTDPDKLAVARQRSKDLNIPLLGLRFSKDYLCPPQRFEELERQFGSRFRKIVIDSSPGNPYGISRLSHAVLTTGYNPKPGHPARLAYEEVIQFLAGQLGR
jgi:dienelactone hydrolase